MRWMLAVMLAGCGSDAGEGDPTCPGCADAPDCEPHPNGAPCCPTDFELKAGDCPEGTTLQTSGAEDPTGSTTTQCRNDDGSFFPESPYTSVDNVTGGLATVRRPGDDYTLNCWPATGFHRARIENSATAAACYVDCFTEDGARAPCAEAVGPMITPCD